MARILIFIALQVYVITTQSFADSSIRVSFLNNGAAEKTVITCQDGHSKIIDETKLSATSEALCPGLGIAALTGAFRITLGESAILLMSGRPSAEDLAALGRQKNIRSSVLRIADNGARGSISSELLKLIAPSYVVVAADAPIGNPEKNPDSETLKIISDYLSSTDPQFGEYPVVACNHDTNTAICTWRSQQVHQNLFLTSDGTVEFLLSPQGVELVEEQPISEMSVDCRSGAADTDKVIKISRIWRHSGVLVPPSELTQLDLPAGLIRADTAWVDISWGDEVVFLGSDEQNTIQNYIAAGWLHRRSVVRLAATDGDDGTGYIAVHLDTTGYRRLLDFIKASIAHDAAGQVIDRTNFADPGLSLDSAIYLQANDIVPIPRSCNRWTAIALSHAGCETWPAITLTNSQLWETMARLRR